MIIDFHCHAGQGDRLTAPWNTNAPLDRYLPRARAAGIRRTVVIPAGHSDYSTANAELARIVARHRGRLIGFASVHSNRDAGRVHEDGSDGGDTLRLSRFGSDGPWLHPGVELYKIRMLRLPAREEALIMGGNARRLLCQSNWSPRATTDGPPSGRGTRARSAVG